MLRLIWIAISTIIVFIWKCAVTRMILLKYVLYWVWWMGTPVTTNDISTFPFTWLIFLIWKIVAIFPLAILKRSWGGNNVLIEILVHRAHNLTAEKFLSLICRIHHIQKDLMVVYYNETMFAVPLSTKISYMQNVKYIWVLVLLFFVLRMEKKHWGECEVLILTEAVFSMENF